MSAIKRLKAVSTLRHFDIAIVGASISGASLAACVGKEGLTVALIDKDSFPRRKACGEGLSNMALEALGRMGFETEGLTKNGKPYYAYKMDLGLRSFNFASGRQRQLKGVGVQRLFLDTLIVDSACELPSVTPFLENSVTEIEQKADNHLLKLSSGKTISARFLVLADGANSVNASRLNIPRHRKAPPLWGISFMMEGVFKKTPDEVVVLLKDGFEINCTPVSDTRLNVTFLSEKNQVKPLQDPSYRNELLAEATLKSSFQGKPIGKPLQVGPVCATRRAYTYNKVMLIGDVAETLDPIAGMGMTHGILMAEIAAKTLVSIFKDGTPLETAFHDHSIQSEKMSRPYRGFTRLTASLLRSPARGLLLPFLSATFLPGLIRTALDKSDDKIAFVYSLPKIFLSLVGI